MRVRRSILTMATHALFMVVTMAVSLPATPYLIGWLGESVYGGVRVVNDAFGWLTLLELGLGGAIGPLLAGAIGRNDDRALRETVAAGVRAYFWVMLASLAVGVVLTPIVPWFAKGLNAAELADLRRGWLLQLIAFVPLVTLPFRSVFDARQRGYIINLFMLGQSLIITGCSLLLARAGWGVTGQAAAQVIGVWSFSAAITLGVRRTEPGLLSAMITTPTSPETRAALRGLSGPSLWLNLSGRISVLSDNLVIGNILGARMVTSLVNTQKLVLMGQSLLVAVGGASWAALADLYAKGERETFNHRVVEMTRMITILAVIGFVPVIGFNRDFIRIWLGPGFEYGGDLVVVLAALNGVFLATQSLWGWCFTATGKIRLLIPQATAAAILNIATSIGMTRLVGLPGPLIGSTTAFVLVGLWASPWLLRRTFGTSIRDLASAIGVPLAVGSFCAWGLREIVRAHPPQGWGSLVAGMSVAALLMLAVGVSLLMTAEDRALWKIRLAGLWPRGATS